MKCPFKAIKSTRYSASMHTIMIVNQHPTQGESFNNDSKMYCTIH